MTTATQVPVRKPRVALRPRSDIGKPHKKSEFPRADKGKSHKKSNVPRCDKGKPRENTKPRSDKGMSRNEKHRNTFNIKTYECIMKLLHDNGIITDTEVNNVKIDDVKDLFLTMPVC